MQAIKQEDFLDEPLPNPRGLIRNISEMSIECNDDVLYDETPTKEIEIDRSVVAEKVRAIFELPSSELLVGVTLPGWMYVTDHRVCFYASLPRAGKKPRKAGYLSKKPNWKQPGLYRYYFVLQNNALSWYESAESKYLPIETINLNHVVEIEERKGFGIKIVTEQKSFKLIADSEVSQKEWMDELQRGVFVTKNVGSSVRIMLPFNKMSEVTKSSAFEFAEYIKIRITDVEDADEQADEDLWSVKWLQPEQTQSNIALVDDTYWGMGDFWNVDVQSGSTPSAVSAALLGALSNSMNLLNNQNDDKDNAVVDTTLRKHGPERAEANKPSSITPLSLSQKLLSKKPARNATESESDTPLRQQSCQPPESYASETPQSDRTELDGLESSTSSNIARKQENGSTGKQDRKNADIPRRVRSSTETLAKIPRVLTDALHHVYRGDDLRERFAPRSSNTTSAPNSDDSLYAPTSGASPGPIIAPKPTHARHFRNRSLSSLRNFALSSFQFGIPSRLVEKASESTPHINGKEYSQGVNKGHKRDSSKSSVPEHTTQPQENKPKALYWISNQFVSMFERDDHQTEESEQERMDGMLRQYFPMVGETETVLAGE
ncbi:Sterol 3-beta-glucosyltransferase [Apophysomyces sp. BC1034]|nr:Sterol 3-beta-glucosyltransferase [Apophysomyces sp. BC1021]KAG0186395.1 Sterol 3-beta-glucosyltransferase [Apophysomyces sp. BC1034]